MGGRDRAVKLYVRALDLSGVYLATRVAAGEADSAGGCPTHVGHGADPAGRVRRLGENVRLHRLFWCATASQAELLCERVRADLALFGPPERGGWFAVDVRTAAESTARAADELGVTTQSRDEVDAAAAKAVAQIEQKFAELQRTGGLKTINKAYREYRLERQAAGETVMLYAGYLENYKLRMIRAVAETSRTLDARAFGNLA